MEDRLMTKTRSKPPASPRSRVLLFTGDGKGKSTAALGLAVRAVGHGLKACIVQFIKSSPTGEQQAPAALEGLEIVQTGEGFLPPDDDPRFARHVAAARAGLDLARERIAGGQHGVVVLDEVCVAAARGLLTCAEIIDAVAQGGPGTVVVLTGRGAPRELIDLADTVSEMRCVKHGFDQGIQAQKGVEY